MSVKNELEEIRVDSKVTDEDINSMSAVSEKSLEIKMST